MRGVENEKAKSMARSQKTSQLFAIFSFKAGGAGLALLSSLIIARLIGAEEYGIYAYALSWITLLSIPAKLGTDHLIVREVAIFGSMDAWGRVRGILSWSNKAILISTFGIVFISLAFFGLLHKQISFLTMLVAFFILPYLVLSSARQSVLRGMHRIILSLLPEMIAKPTLLVLGLLVLWIATPQVNHLEVLWVYLIVTFVVFLIYQYAVRLSLPVKKIIPPEKAEIMQWMKSIMPFALLDAAAIINSRSDVIMIGIMKDPEMAGIYNIATNGADIISFMLVAVNMTIAPLIAALYHKNKLKELREIMKKTARTAFLAGVPLLGVMIFFGGRLMGLFGKEFVVGHQALIILSLGQIVNIGTGSVGLLLNMTGNEKLTAAGFGIASAGNILLNLVLIPFWGINGAAISTFISTSVWNVMLLVIVIRKMRLNPSIF